MSTEIWYTCDTCGDEQTICEGEEFNDLTETECVFCRNGNYKNMTIYRDGEKISEVL